MINQISMSNYRAVDRNFDRRMAKQAGLPLWLRIVHAAAAEMNRSGHAHFGGWSNIAESVAIEGEPEPKRAGVYKALATAIEFGYIDSSSDAQCILFDSRDTQKSAHGSYGCKYKKHSETWRSAAEIRKEIEKSKNEVVDTETGEILESPVSPSEESGVQSDQVIIPAPENPTEGQDEAEMTDEEVKAILDEDIDFGSDEVVEVKNPMAWFDELDGMAKDVAAFGLMFKKRDGIDRIRAVALESVKEEYDIWGENYNMRYSYASMNVDVPMSNDSVTKIMEEAW